MSWQGGGMGGSGELKRRKGQGVKMMMMSDDVVRRH